MKRRMFLALFGLAASACIPSTGGALVRFSAEAHGPSASVAGQPLSFQSDVGFNVELSKARVRVGAVYLNRTNPASYAGETACLQPGIYTGEVRGGLFVDVLSPAPQPFDIEGVGTSDATRSAEIWFAAGDVNEPESSTAYLDVAGTAKRGADTWPFEGRVTFGKNRLVPPRDPALPGSNPLCKQRIVSPIPVDFALGQGGTLSLSIDPRPFFSGVNFSQLKASASDPSKFEFVDDSSAGAQPDAALYAGFRSIAPYTLEFKP